MPDATFTVNDKFKALVNKAKPGALDQAQRRAAVRFAISLDGALKRATLNTGQGRTGFLKKSWYARVEQGGKLVVAGNTSPYAAAYNNGSKRHRVPKAGIPGRGGQKVLAWRSGGRGAASSFKGGKTTGADVFVSGRPVWIPKRAGKRVWEKTLKKQEPKGLKMFSEEIERALRGS